MDSAWLRTVFLIIHVVTAGMVFAQIPIGLYFKRSINAAAGTPGELPLMATMGQLHGALGSIGGIGLLLSGLGLVAVRNFGILGLFGAMPLALWIKQVAFIIIMVIIIAVLNPVSKRAAASLQAAAQGGGGVTGEAREHFTRIEQISYLVNALTVLNIIVGVALTSGAMM